MRMKFKQIEPTATGFRSQLPGGRTYDRLQHGHTGFCVRVQFLAAGPNSYGEIDVFEINAVSGFMRPIPASPFPSGGRDPVAEAVSSDNATLYVVNQLDNNIVQFLIGSDGKIYPQNTVNTPGYTRLPLP